MSRNGAFEKKQLSSVCLARIPSVQYLEVSTNLDQTSSLLVLWGISRLITYRPLSFLCGRFSCGLFFGVSLYCGASHSSVFIFTGCTGLPASFSLQRNRNKASNRLNDTVFLSSLAIQWLVGGFVRADCLIHFLLYCSYSERLKRCTTLHSLNVKCDFNYSQGRIDSTCRGGYYGH